MTSFQRFVQMINHPLYEIMVDYPHTIRRIDNQRTANESENGKGYIQVWLKDGDRRCGYLKHRLIAEQFIPNPDNLPQVDHINHQRDDNHINNLRWVSNSMNQYNRSSFRGVQYEFIDDIPEEAIIVDFYNVRNERKIFEEGKYYYYFDEETNEDIFYSRIDENTYKVLHINATRGGLRLVSLRDTNNRSVNVYINRFKYQHDLL